MLGKCFKYEFKKMLKFLSIFFGLAIFFSALSRGITTLGDTFLITFLASFMQGAAISMMFSILMNCVLRTWAEFRTSFYGDPSYLTHTLPVKKKTLYLSKVLCVSLLVFISLVVILACVAILFLNQDTVDFIKLFLGPVAEYFHLEIWSLIVSFFFLIFLEVMSGIASGFFGLVLGHTRLHHKILSSVFFGFLFYLLGELVLVIVLFAIGLMSPSFMEIFTTSNLFALDSGVATVLFAISFVVYGLFSVSGFYLGYLNFKKGVNVD